MKPNWPPPAAELPAWRRSLTYLLALITPSSFGTPDQIYHYTSAEACFSILNGQPDAFPAEPVLRASSAFCMNDTSELNHGLRLLERIASSYTSSEVINAYFGPELAQGRRALADVVGLSTIIAFSGKPDVLSQWRAYGRGGAGYAIGFNVERLVDRGRSATDEFVLARMIYDERQQTQILNQIFDGAAAIEKEENVTDPRFWPEVLRLGTMAALLFKDSSFEEEAEWRLMCRFPQSLLFRAGRLGVIPYNELKLSCDCISALWQGPMLDQQMTARAWQIFFAKRYAPNYPPVHSSRIPLRSV